ncbi:hypothetical protein K1719_036606 [Acacia pycnantha]|nr:hypothetical protein K1719_036606 [Acacia pycnantha]
MKEIVGLCLRRLWDCVKKLSFEVKEIARNISDECEGFPLAIVRVATSMKGKKQVRQWSHMLECLKNLGNGQYEMDTWVFPVLKSSYDFLTNKLRRFFLNCVLNAKNESFSDYDSICFIRFVYDSIGEAKKLRVLYNEGYDMLDKLKDHSMLDECYGKWRMNKFLRALAINIAKTGEIMANAYKYLIEIPSDDQWKDDLQKVFRWETRYNQF